MLKLHVSYAYNITLLYMYNVIILYFLGWRIQYVSANMSIMQENTVGSNELTATINGLRYNSKYVLLLNAYTSVGNGDVYSTSIASTLGWYICRFFCMRDHVYACISDLPYKCRPFIGGVLSYANTVFSILGLLSSSCYSYTERPFQIYFFLKH